MKSAKAYRDVPLVWEDLLGHLTEGEAEKLSKTCDDPPLFSTQQLSLLQVIKLLIPELKDGINCNDIPSNRVASSKTPSFLALQKLKQVL